MFNIPYPVFAAGQFPVDSRLVANTIAEINTWHAGIKFPGLGPIWVISENSYYYLDASLQPVPLGVGGEPPITGDVNPSEVIDVEIGDVTLHESISFDYVLRKDSQKIFGANAQVLVNGGNIAPPSLGVTVESSQNVDVWVNEPYVNAGRIYLPVQSGDVAGIASYEIFNIKRKSL